MRVSARDSPAHVAFVQRAQGFEDCAPCSPFVPAQVLEENDSGTGLLVYIRRDSVQPGILALDRNAGGVHGLKVICASSIAIKCHSELISCQLSSDKARVRPLKHRVGVPSERAVALAAATTDYVMWCRGVHVDVLQIVVMPRKVRLHPRLLHFRSLICIKCCDARTRHRKT